MNFFETLYSALDSVRIDAEKRQIVFNNEAAFERFSSGMVYGETRESHCEIESIKGKKTAKWLHITVWRHETGRYEVNHYVL